jgi:hypothetical protein
VILLVGGDGDGNSERRDLNSDTAQGNAGAGAGAGAAENDSSATTVSPLNVPIWPFVLAAQGRARMFMPFPNLRLLTLARDSFYGGPAAWDERLLDTMVRTATGKLHGMGSCFSGMTAKVLAVEEVVLVPGSEEKIRRSLYNSGRGRILRDINRKQGEFKALGQQREDKGVQLPVEQPSKKLCVNAPVRQILAVVAINMTNFELGRDGQLCFEAAGGKKLACMIRKDQPQIVVSVLIHSARSADCSVQSNSVGSASPKSRSETTTSLVSSSAIFLKLRGNMFADIISDIRLDLPLEAGFRDPLLRKDEDIKYASIARSEEPFVEIEIVDG